MVPGMVEINFEPYTSGDLSIRRRMSSTYSSEFSAACWTSSLNPAKNTQLGGNGEFAAIPANDGLDDCTDITAAAAGAGGVGFLRADICFAADEIISVKRDGQIMDISIRNARYTDKILSVNDEMETIWDDILILDHFTTC